MERKCTVQMLWIEATIRPQSTMKAALSELLADQQCSAGRIINGKMSVKSVLRPTVPLGSSWSLAAGWWPAQRSGQPAPSDLGDAMASRHVKKHVCPARKGSAPALRLRGAVRRHGGASAGQDDAREARRERRGVRTAARASVTADAIWGPQRGLKHRGLL
eukprot:6192431-Pleurochrysis_carterae.AAC.5